MPGLRTVGINAALLYSSAFAIGAGLAALGGIVGAELLPMEANYPVKYLVLFLAVVAVGGQGALFGTFLAAILLGIINTARNICCLKSHRFGSLTMLVVPALRPQGLFGRKESSVMADLATATYCPPGPGSGEFGPNWRCRGRCSAALVFPDDLGFIHGSTSWRSSPSRWRS